MQLGEQASSQRLGTLTTLFGDKISLTTSPSRLIHCKLSLLQYNGHSLLLSSYLYRIKRKENSSCSTCGHPLQDLTHLDCPESEPLRSAIFGTTSIFDLWSRSWGMAQLLGLRGVSWCPHPSERCSHPSVAPPPPKSQLWWDVCWYVS